MNLPSCTQRVRREASTIFYPSASLLMPCLFAMYKYQIQAPDLEGRAILVRRFTSKASLKAKIYRNQRRLITILCIKAKAPGILK